MVKTVEGGNYGDMHERRKCKERTEGWVRKKVGRGEIVEGTCGQGKWEGVRARAWFSQLPKWLNKPREAPV
jgi:hypothetical protein